MLKEEIYVCVVSMYIKSVQALGLNVGLCVDMFGCDFLEVIIKCLEFQ